MLTPTLLAANVGCEVLGRTDGAFASQFERYHHRRARGHLIDVESHPPRERDHGGVRPVDEPVEQSQLTCAAKRDALLEQRAAESLSL